jgi:hypothetical protein
MDMPDVYKAEKAKKSNNKKKIKTVVVDVTDEDREKSVKKMKEKEVEKGVEKDKRVDKKSEVEEGNVGKERKKHVKEYSEVMRGEERTKNPLAAFMVRPKSVKVDIQDEKEEVLLLLRRHVITNIPWVLTVLAMGLAPILLGFMPIFGFLPFKFQVMGVMLWYLLTIGVAIEGFLSWYFNVYIVTDERVIDVDFLNLLYKNISTAKIDTIEDVTVEMTGSWQSLFNYGLVLIQTAAEKTQFEFEYVPQPQKVAKFINEMMLEEEREKIEGRVR